MKKFLLVLLLAILANAELELDSCQFFSHFKTFEFVEYTKDQNTYNRVFERLKEDFLVGKSNLQDIKNQSVIGKYIDLRNTWLAMDNTEAFILALELTRLLETILQVYTYNFAEKYISPQEYKAVMEKYLERVVLSKYKLFPKLDNVGSRTSYNWRSLPNFEKADTAGGKTIGWNRYIESVGLLYFRDENYNIEFLTNEDTINDSFFGWCGFEYIKKPDVVQLIIETAAVIDFGKLMKEIYSYYSANNFVHDQTKLILHLSKRKCKKKDNWLYFHQIDCNKDIETLSRCFFLNTNILSLFFDCENN